MLYFVKTPWWIKKIYSDCIWQIPDSEKKKYIDSDLFRPPYGKITNFQRKRLAANYYQLRVIMWSVLSGDFDRGISSEKCFANVIKNTVEGSIIVFHDSEKAFERLRY